MGRGKGAGVLSRKRAMKTVVVGVGNLLMGDEGVGVHIVERLKHLPLPSDVVVVDGGTQFWGDEEILNGAKKLIVIDAVLGGGTPGTIYRFGLDELEDETEGLRLSCHDMGLIEKLRLMQLAGVQPRQTVIIGVEPAHVEYSTSLSKEVESKVPEIIDVVMTELTLPAEDEAGGQS